MIENRTPEWHLLDRYMAGDASPHERAVVEKWLAENAGRRELLRDVARMGEEPSIIEPRADVNSDWQAFAAKLVTDNNAPAARANNSRNIRSSWKYFSIAASLAVITAAGAWQVTDHAKAPSATTKNYSTTSGQRAAITLDDGSVITLAPDSKMAAMIGTGARNIELIGQAVFTVSQDNARPFTVTARGITTRVLGTTFGIRAYESDNDVKVAVSEGKVSVQQAIVTAGSMATVNNGNVAKVTRADATLLSWRDGTMAFENKPVREVLADLSRWYDVEMTLPDDLVASKRLTASFDGQTLTTAIIERIALALGASYTWHGRTITFTPNR